MKQLLLMALLFATSCDKADDAIIGGGTETNYVKGKVTDTKGNPVSGAKIIVDNTVFYNSGTTGTTDANGNYKIPVGIGSWRVYAEIDRTFNGKNFKKPEMHPDKDNAFAGADGATVNFQWKLEGEKPAPLVGFYGGTAYLYADSESEIYDSQNIEFTFTPIGNLIDGNPGQVIKRKGGQPNSGTYSQVPDIPIGKYMITAKHIPTDKTLKLRTAYEGDYDTSMVTVFEPEFNFCSRCLTIQFTDQ
ncbi:MAG: carboxypeptidase regulatory-like domain-containing protein [Chitinophagaceae bacterium]|nr:carboxypeptidase regulatory-like domain-containing protein [Chitinophagaceae bacterium]